MSSFHHRLCLVYLVHKRIHKIFHITICVFCKEDIKKRLLEFEKEKNMN